MMRYAFHVDASACSGCKACQVACKDRNQLPLGVLWRRVYEVSGGGWQRRDDAWVSDVFAYNLPLGCNHCEHPACVDVCPTGAMHANDDGVVLIERAHCIGCRYCEWACPYGAPQYDKYAGTMGKCTACIDDVTTGKPPACVAACGLRALDFGTAEEMLERHGNGRPMPFPLPDAALTRPSLLLEPHPGAASAHAGNARIANVEEVAPAAGQGKETSLVLFTLLTQLAAGMFAVDLATAWRSGGTVTVHAATALIMAAAALISLLHLGRPERAWRAIRNLRTSWLSREILLTIAFATAVLGTAAAGTTTPRPLSLATAALGLVLLYVMTRVYQLPAASGWNRARTAWEFASTAAVTGVVAVAMLRAAQQASSRVLALWILAFTLTLALAAHLRERFYQRVLSVPAGPLRALPATPGAPAAS